MQGRLRATTANLYLYQLFTAPRVRTSSAVWSRIQMQRQFFFFGNRSEDVKPNIPKYASSRWPLHTLVNDVCFFCIKTPCCLKSWGWRTWRHYIAWRVLGWWSLKHHVAWRIWRRADEHKDDTMFPEVFGLMNIKITPCWQKSLNWWT